jgi:methyl-accepting chemotaxis protein
MKSIKTKLIAIFSVIGIGLALVLTAVNVFTAASGLNRVADISSTALHTNIDEHLESIALARETLIEDYFATIESQMITFSQDRMVVDAMREFRDYFNTFREENEVTAEQLAEMRVSLEDYYTNQFGAKYTADNDGAAHDALSRLNQLDDDSLALQYYYISANPNPLGSKETMDAPDDGSRYSQLHAVVHPPIRAFLQEFGYYDIFLCDPDTGDIVYSVFKELDYSTSLSDGPYASTNFGRAFQLANAEGNRDAIILTDFEQYYPSYEAPASFIASPIYDGNEKLGVALFQMPLDKISQVMSERAGLGETGEVYMVGPDGLMRSDSYRDPENHSVTASFRSPDTTRIEADFITAALDGSSGKTQYVNYLGDEVISYYLPVNLPDDVTWALTAEITTDEALASVNAMLQERNRSLTTAIITSLAVALVMIIVSLAWGIRFANNTGKPLQHLASCANKMAEGDFRVEIKSYASQDEIGQMTRSFNKMKEQTRHLIQLVASSANNVASASGELSSSATSTGQAVREVAETVSSVAAGAQESSRAVMEAKATLDQAANSIANVNDDITEVGSYAASAASMGNEGQMAATEASELISRAAASVRETSSMVRSLGDKTHQISDFIGIITGIADQTNLLALNAAIEAARAGEAGRGFAVVAEEVRKLAEESNQAAGSITELVKSIESEMGTALEAMERSDEEVATGAETVERAGATLSEIVSSVMSLSEKVHTITSAANEINSSTTDLVNLMETLGESAMQNAESSKQVSAAVSNQSHTMDEIGSSSGRLADLSRELSELVARFKV